MPSCTSDEGRCLALCTPHLGVIECVVVNLPSASCNGLTYGAVVATCTGSTGAGRGMATRLRQTAPGHNLQRVPFQNGMCYKRRNTVHNVQSSMWITHSGFDFFARSTGQLKGNTVWRLLGQRASWNTHSHHSLLLSYNAQ